jgi:hypothetical protein
LQEDYYGLDVPHDLLECGIFVLWWSPAAPEEVPLSRVTHEVADAAFTYDELRAREPQLRLLLCKAVDGNLPGSARLRLCTTEERDAECQHVRDALLRSRVYLVTWSGL